tara:strand:+ start:3339 stop:3518 length:180 start_codon:yes stop_codon:yes gene_type:complete
MTTVWLVMLKWEDYIGASDEVKGVFSSKEKADAFVVGQTDHPSPCMGGSFYDVEEFEVE